MQGIARHRIKLDLIARHWDDLLRVAGSLKLGKVSASELMRTLQTKSRPSSLARAIAELGRIIKTLYLLAYIDHETYRRRILTQLNRGEGRQALAREICYGHKGELRQKYREGLEDQLGALGLVLNALVLLTTGYLDRALTDLRTQGVPVLAEDVARLSPLSHHHVHLLGCYQFSLSAAQLRGEPPPLRDLAAVPEQLW